MALLLKKLRHAYIWNRLFYERFTEPLHLNLLSIVVAAVGNFRARVAFDLVLRCQHAHCILKCADQAKARGLKRVTLIEFGVAAGAGLLNMAKIAGKVTRVTGIEFEIFGFDTGKGMPAPRSYLDHPDLYQQGDFAMDASALQAALPPNVHLLMGEIAETSKEFLKALSPDAPIGFVSIDTDYYYSTKDALAILENPATHYLPKTLMYLDDLEDESHNSYCGEQLAVAEFNNEHAFRKIEKHTFLRSYRLFKNARWIDHVFTLHVLDHPHRTLATPKRNATMLENPYLSSSDLV